MMLVVMDCQNKLVCKQLAGWGEKRRHHEPPVAATGESRVAPQSHKVSKLPLLGSNLDSPNPGLYRRGSGSSQVARNRPLSEQRARFPAPDCPVCSVKR
jgi:hypothetical protein